MRFRGNRHSDGQAHDTLRTVLFASIIAALLASSVAVVSAARTLDIGPKVGDILVFQRGASMPVDWDFVVETNHATACTLTPAVMAMKGGSLVVEQKLDTSKTYRVHWAGGATSDNGSNCGDQADLVVGRVDLQLLSNAVGGPGVEHRLFAGL